MKKIIFYLIFSIATATGLRAADGDLFPYPKPPADMERLDERCDYIISQFWRQCDFKSAMSQYDKLRSTFNDWVQLMPYANSDVVHSSIDQLIAKVAKSGPQTLALARMAEESLYSDSAEMRSAEIFLPFAKAAAAHKKISQADREHYGKMVKQMENAMVGKPIGFFEITTPEGMKSTLDNYRTQMVVLLFNSHDNSDSSMARVRLSTDHSINQLIERGLLTVISVEPGKASPDWLAATATYPSNWIVGAMPSAKEWFELDKEEPTILLLDGRHKLLAKGLSIDGLKMMMNRFKQQSGL